jgi:hypothetical protein
LALNAEKTRAEAAAIIRSLVDEIVLTPENGTLQIDLKGAFAGILAVACNSKKPAAGRSGPQILEEQIKMVAGTGNHRQLTFKCSI